MQDYIIKKLFEMQDSEYRDFHAKLIPGINKDTVIGVRTPLLRAFAKELCGKEGVNAYLKDLPHKYYEENNLHSFIICQIKDYDECISLLDRFLPCVDNWATCDGIKPKCFNKNKDRLIEKICEWLKSDKVYTVRFAILMLMTHYLDGDFKPEYLSIISKIKSDEYYINMMIAWFFATALAKRWSAAIIFIENRTLPAWVHNKAITKARESYRITPEQKDYLKTLRV